MARRNHKCFAGIYLPIPASVFNHVTSHSLKTGNSCGAKTINIQLKTGSGKINVLALAAPTEGIRRHCVQKKKEGFTAWVKPSLRAATYFPTNKCSIIGDAGLNFSVRNGKRCAPAL